MMRPRDTASMIFSLFCLEVEHLVQALKAAGKTDKFEYKIYQNAPGVHSFNRNDN